LDAGDMVDFDVVVVVVVVVVVGFDVGDTVDFDVEVDVDVDDVAVVDFDFFLKSSLAFSFSDFISASSSSPSTSISMPPGDVSNMTFARANPKFRKFNCSELISFLMSGLISTFNPPPDWLSGCLGVNRAGMDMQCKESRALEDDWEGDPKEIKEEDVEAT
jgi:hypothetical protein